MSFKILSVKSEFPKKYENIKSLKFKNIDHKKLFQATGINKRYVSSDQENVITLSLKSAKKLIKKNIKKKIGFLFFVSQTSPYKFPSAACILQNKLDLPNDIFALDINMGCSGFIYALKLAESFKDSDKKYGLIICSDTYTKFINKKNKSCKPIFSDASTATLLQKTKQKKFRSFDFGVDGSGYKDLMLPHKSKNMFMNGAKVAIFTLKTIPDFIKNFIKKNKIDSNKIKFLLLHQASRYVCEKIKKKLELKNSIYLNNYNIFGNTISSSIPLLIEKAIKNKKFKKGDILLACGFGVGLSWGVVEIKW